MKATILIIGFLAFAGPACAGTLVDTAGLGAEFGGWKQNRTAVHLLESRSYRVWKPEAKTGAEGVVSVSTRIDAGSTCPAAIVFLELGFGVDGELASARIHGRVGGKRADTGSIQMPVAESAPEAAAGGAGTAAVVVSKPVVAPIRRLEADLFDAFRSSVSSEGGGPDGAKRDLSNRVCGRCGIDGNTLTNDLRHHWKILLRHVHGDGK